MFLGVCLVLSCAAVSFTLFGPYRFTFHSDAAIKTVLARQAWQEGTIVPHNWIYANGDLFFVGPQIFGELLYPWLGVGYLANAFSSWLAYLITLVMVYVGGRSATRSPLVALLGTVLIASGLSVANFEFVFGQSAYSMYAGIAVMLFGLSARSQFSREGRSKWFLVSLVAAAAALASASNPTRGMVTIVLPLVIGWIAARVLVRSEPGRSRWSCLRSPVVVSVVLGGIVGSLINHFLLMPHLQNFEAAARAGLASPSDMLKHLAALPAAWLRYFNLVGSWSSLSVGLKLLQLVAWSLGFAALGAPVWIIVRRWREPDPLVVFSWMLLAAYGISFLALIVSAQLLQGAMEMRYATFPLLGSMYVVAAIVNEELVSRFRRGWLAFVVMGSLSVAIGVTMTQGRGENALDMAGSYKQRMALIDVLQKLNVGTIAATYWHSHVLTVLSNGSVNAYPVTASQVIVPFVHHMPTRVSYGGAGRYQALVLTNQEALPPVVDAASRQFGPPIKHLSFGDYQIWIYDHDIVGSIVAPVAVTNIPVDRNSVRLGISENTFEPCSDCVVPIEVMNLGERTLGAAGSKPLRLGVFGLDEKGRRTGKEARAEFLVPLKKGERESLLVTLPAADEKTVTYKACLVQEMVDWLCDRTEVSPGNRANP